MVVAAVRDLALMTLLLELSARWKNGNTETYQDQLGSLAAILEPGKPREALVVGREWSTGMG